MLTGSGDSPGSTMTLNFGTLQVGTSSGATVSGSGTITLSNAASYGVLGTVSAAAPTTPPTPISAGPVFYIVTEGAGLGDSVRSVPCTGKETVLTAVGHINGVPQVSSAKIWIARPSPNRPDKSTILSIDWEAVSRYGINATNYTLLPGDRLVFGADPLATRTNVMAKRMAPVERMAGIVGLTTSTVRGLNATPGASNSW